MDGQQRRDPKLAYVLEVVAGVVRSCSCPAGEFGDPCCKHAARYYLDAGLLDPEPEPPALGVMQDCPDCRGCGVLYDRDLEQHGLLYPTLSFAVASVELLDRSRDIADAGEFFVHGGFD